MDPVLDWKKKVEIYQLPRWNELPEISLYLDQVLEYVNEILNPIFIEVNTVEPFLTAAMINNYVKHKHIPAPIKKRYTKDHIAFIISITILKQITNLTNVSVGVRTLTSKLGKEHAYNTFVNYLETALKVIVVDDNDVYKQALLEETNEHLLPLKTITVAFTSKMLAEYLLNHMVRQNKGEQK